MKAALFVFVLLMLSTVLWAQRDNPGNCGFSSIVEDPSCGDGCKSNTFTAPYTASDYCLFCQMINCSGFYSECHATMTLTRVSDSATIATCDNQGTEHCDHDFPSSQCSVTLQGQVMYKLTVCMNACPGGGNCSNCVDCVARAQVCHQ